MFDNKNKRIHKILRENYNACLKNKFSTLQVYHFLAKQALSQSYEFHTYESISKANCQKFWDNKHFKCQTAKGKHSPDMRANWNPESHCCSLPDFIVVIFIFFFWFFSGFWFLFAGQQKQLRNEILWLFSGRCFWSIVRGKCLSAFFEHKLKFDEMQRLKSCNLC